jgi:molecular chaperone DnaK
MSVRVPVGIDLGTTFCAVAIVNGDGSTEMIPNRWNEILTPSVAYLGDEQVVVGKEALPLGLAAPQRFVESVKRCVGKAELAPVIDGETIPVEVIQGYLLKSLDKDIQYRAGSEYSCVVTVPQYFNERRRQSVVDSCTLSGLPVVDIISEPTAAALAYGEKLGYLDASGEPFHPLNVLIFDLGGGTFDVTILRLKRGDFCTLAADGDAELGGLDWDQRLSNLLLKKFQSARTTDPKDDPKWLHEWKAKVIAAKHQLSSSAEARVEFDLDGQCTTLAVTRDEFEQATADLVERTMFTMRSCLRTAGLAWQNIDRVLVVGGASRMPMIGTAIRSASGIAPETCINPDEAVARGAAIFAQQSLIKAGHDVASPLLKIQDVCSHSLGLIGTDMRTMHRCAVPVIRRNSPLPAEVHRKFVTKVNDQRSVAIELVEGESSVPEHNSVIGRIGIRNIPPGIEAGSEINVIYRYEANGRLQVTAHMEGLGDQAVLEVERLREFDDKSLDRWKKVMARHGGFNDFAEAIAWSIFENSKKFAAEAPVERPAAPAADAKLPPAEKKNLEPAVNLGAPLAASETLKEVAAERVASAQANRPSLMSSGLQPRSAGPTKLPAIVSLIGFLMSGVAGIGLGYYLLCRISPERNFLNLNLPGIERPASRK